MSAFVKFNAFVEALAEKIHNLGSDQIKVALTNTLPAPTAATITDISEISYTNCSSRDITTSSSSQTAGLYKLVLADLTLTAAGGSIAPFRYIVLYNDTAASDNLIGYYDYGSTLTLADTESLVIDFDATAGVITLQ